MFVELFEMALFDLVRIRFVTRRRPECKDIFN